MVPRLILLPTSELAIPICLALSRLKQTSVVQRCLPVLEGRNSECVFHGQAPRMFLGLHRTVCFMLVIMTTTLMSWSACSQWRLTLRVPSRKGNPQFRLYLAYVKFPIWIPEHRSGIPEYITNVCDGRSCAADRIQPYGDAR